MSAGVPPDRDVASLRRKAARFAAIVVFASAAQMAFLLAFLSASLLAPDPAQAQSAGRPDRCALALMLAIDVSSSVSQREYLLQVEGHAAAFRDQDVIATIKAVGGIKVAMSHWSGADHQEIVHPWTRLVTEDDIRRFAKSLSTTPRRYAFMSTGVGAALQYYRGSFGNAVSNCRRRVIDISGDGISNDGVAVAGPRNALLEAGVVINGLVILTDELVEGDPARFFEQRVIGGPGSFMIVANGFSDYARAFKLKLLREIGLPVGRRDPDGDLGPPRKLGQSGSGAARLAASTP